MKKIKFRGRNSKTGEFHYGHYSDYPICGGRIETCITDQNLDSWVVAPESIAQFVGYDKNGKEIYSDETVFCSDGNERLVADILVNFNSIGGHFDNVMLKEN